MNHADNAAVFTRDDARTHWHDQALWFVRAKRDRMANSLPEWETLRETASAIKNHTVSRLADLLEEFESNATKLGATVHWASTPARAQRDRAQHPAEAWRHARREEQVDAH